MWAQSGSEAVLVSDDFTGGTINTAKWVVNVLSGHQDTTIPVVQRNNRIEIGPLSQNATDSSYNALLSVNTYNLTGAYAWVQAVQPPPGSTSADLMFTLPLNNTNHYRIFMEHGSLKFEKKISGLKTTVAAVTFNAATHAFWRIRHNSTSDQIIFETAPNSGGRPGSWTARATIARQLAITATKVELKAGTYQPETTAPGIVAFDRVRVARPLPETTLLSDTFTGTTLDSTKWTVGVLSGHQDTAVPVAQRNDRVEVGPLKQNATDSAYNALLSANTINLTGAYASVLAVQAPPSSTMAALMFTLPLNNTNHYRIFVDSGVLNFETKIAGTKSTVASVTYSASTHAFWRIRHESAGDQIVFETAPNNAGAPGSWTTRATVARQLSITALKVELKGGTFQPESVAPGIVAFDDVRVAKPATPAECTYLISPTSTTSGSSGGSGSVAVSAAAGCAWTAVSNVSWITGGGNGTGAGSVAYSVSTNTTTSNRTGTITIAGHTFTIAQAAPSAPNCTYLVSPTDESVGSGNQSAAVTVSTGNGCSWTAGSNVGFMQIESGAAGTGSGTVTYFVQNNVSSSSRTGTLTVAGRTVTVTQAGISTPSCSYSVSPTNETVSPDNQHRTINVTTGNGCSWSAQSLSNFMQITSGASGSGSGTVTYFVENSTAPENRTGTLEVAGRVVTIVQTGIVPSSGVGGTIGGSGQTSPGTGGDLVTEPSCTWWVWTDDPGYPVSITATLTADGQVIGQGTQWGLGAAQITVSGQLTVDRRDHQVECFGTSEFGSGVDRLFFPARVPADVQWELDVLTTIGFANYERLRIYSVRDNYQYRYGYSGTQVAEAFSVGENGCNLTMVTGGASLNTDAEFEDRYSTLGSPIPACAVVPSCVTRTTQTYTIESRTFSHPVIWSCTNVDVQR